jgi:DNA-binding transcriptional regulator YdaS (Cro superfamily)
MNAFEEFLGRHGATAELARGLGVTHAAVRQWEGRVPAERVIEVERLTGIPREALRPDLYRRDPILPALVEGRA